MELLVNMIETKKALNELVNDALHRCWQFFILTEV